MASKAQLNDESFNIFLTQKTNLGEKAINLMSLSGVWFFFFLCLSRAFGFFLFFLFVVQGMVSLSLAGI